MKLDKSLMLLMIVWMSKIVFSCDPDYCLYKVKARQRKRDLCDARETIVCFQAEVARLKALHLHDVAQIRRLQDDVIEMNALRKQAFEERTVAMINLIHNQMALDAAKKEIDRLRLGSSK